MFWINANTTQISSEPRLLFQVNYIDLYYENGKIKLGLGDSDIPVVTLEGTFTIDGLNHYITFELNKSTNKAHLYIDDVLKDTKDITALGDYSNSEDLFIGCKDNVHFFKGLIDEVRVYDAIKTPYDKTYIYTNKIGSLRKIANKFYKEDLSLEETYITSIWDIIHGCIKANTIKDEKLAEGDGVTWQFNGTLEYYPIVNNLLSIVYYSDSKKYTIADDGKGNLTGSAATGTINYTTGYYTITCYKNIDITSELIYSGSKSSLSNVFLANTDILETTLKLYYWISGTKYIATDNGVGDISGADGTTGTIDYTLGKINVTFSAATDVDKDITCDYTYESGSTPDSLSEIIAEYKLVNNINPTEIGIYNESDDMVAYATFPPAKFSDYNNHLSFQFFIKKQE